MKLLRLLTAFLAATAFFPVNAADNIFDIDVKKKGAPIQSTMYGIFFEDINFAADGGLYAELVKNRSFEFPNPLQGWKVFGNVRVMNDGPFERNPHYVRLSDPGHSHKHTGLDNEGFFGIGIKRGVDYHFSVWARADRPVTIRIELVNTTSMGENHFLCQQRLTVNSTEWKKYQVTLRPNATFDKSALRIFMETRNGASVDLEHISLFPSDTWKGREGGLRKDLAEALADLIMTAMEAPSWANQQPTKYYVAMDPEKVAAIKNLIGEGNKRNTAGAPVMIVSTYIKSRSGFFRGQAANEIGEGWGAYDNGLSNAFFILKARERGFDTLIMGMRDSDALRNLLDIPEDECIMAVISLGYRALDPVRPARKPLNEVVKFF
jgi:nitroreductase